MGALVALALGLPIAAYPVGRDQAVFLTVARTILDGGRPYIDAWDLKPPGLYVLYASLLATADRVGIGIDLLLGAVNLAVAVTTAGLLCCLASRLAGRPVDTGAAVAMAATYVALLLHGTYWSMGQAETWANLLLVGLALCITSGRVLCRTTAGVLIGGIALLKFTCLAPALVITVWGLRRAAQRQPPPEGGAGALLLALAAGMLLPFLGTGLWLGASGIEAYLEIQRGFVQPYAGIRGAGPLERGTGLFGYGLPYVLEVWPALLLPLLATLAPRRSRLPAIWLAAAIAAVWVQGKYFHYHWQVTFVPLALLAGQGTEVLERGRRLAARAAALLPACWILSAAPGVTLGALRPALRLESWDHWLARFEDGGPDHSPIMTRVAARRLASLARPGDRVMVWGMEPGLYVYSGMRPANRFFFNVPVAAPFAPRAWREEYLASLRADPPRFFVVLRRDAIPHASGVPADSTAQLSAWPELRDWLNPRYELAARVEDFTIFSRVEGSEQD